MDIDVSPTGLPETILPEPSDALRAALEAAVGHPSGLAEVVGANPASVEAWAAMGEHAEVTASDREGQIAAYAFFRVGYHRGLDLLRKEGWKGSGHVRSDHPGNQSFLRCLDGLRRMAGAIGEADEEQRCADFLTMLDPGSDRDGS